MKKCIFFFLMFVSCIGFSQTIYNSQQIGQTGRNQNVSRGFWVKSDTLLTTAAVWIPANAGADKVFTSDANGFGTWQNAINGDSTIAWSLTGNSGTNPATNFIGTTDANPLYIRANNKTGILVDTATNCLTLYNNESLINTLRGFGFLNNNLLIANQNPINNQFGYLKYGANDGFAYYIADNAGVGSAFGLLSNGGNGSQVSNAVFYDRKVGVKTAFQSGVYSVGGQRDGNTEISIIDDTLGIDVASIQGFRPDYSPFFDIKLWDTTGTTSFNIVRLQNIGHNFRMNLTGVAADTISITKGVGVGVLVSASSTNITNKLFSSSFQYTDGTQGAGKVLTSDVDGLASWQGLGGSNGSDIPAYANNAAAFAVLGAGKLYYTDVAGEYIIKVTH